MSRGRDVEGVVMGSGERLPAVKTALRVERSTHLEFHCFSWGIFLLSRVFGGVMEILFRYCTLVPSRKQVPLEFRPGNSTSTVQRVLSWVSRVTFARVFADKPFDFGLKNVDCSQTDER